MTNNTQDAYADLGPVVAYEVRDRTTHETVHRVDVSPSKGRAYADGVFDGLCQRVDFDRFYIDTIYAPTESAGSGTGSPR